MSAIDCVTIELPSCASLPLRVADALGRRTIRPSLDAIARLAWRGPLHGTPAFRIANLAELVAVPLRAPRGTRRRALRFTGFRAEWLWHKTIAGPDDVTGGAILYFHGGGFVAGGLHSHRRIAGRVTRAAGIPLLNVDYRQLPAAHITDTVADALHAYEYLLGLGFAPEKVVFAGDSAGGGLTFAATLAARERGLPMPGGIGAIAPWADLDPARRLAHANDRTDAVLSAFTLSVPALMGFAAGRNLDPRWSPVNHDFTGLPPVFIQVGSTEVLLADAEQLARCCRDAAVPCTVQIWDRALHVFHAGADILPDARAAIADMGRALCAFVDAAAAPLPTDHSTAA
ncbi:alpha/beta hydrolase [Mycolicibacterium mucogenicum]|uniref:Steryl acetyl hydrolase n=1 Tax=Mycolicibacterium mucogenicum TaxID=56689 RepID=A0A4R5WRP4_MYCMU|nr:alpha/beta hydrolase fold domain-containing protein [Mycolicibacterium mucogenicum]TDK93694.1 steryl acetyl hydrolase [Mycolicibacterium mucogenicum]